MTGCNETLNFDTRPLFPPPAWPGYEASKQSYSMLGVIDEPLNLLQNSVILWVKISLVPRLLPVQKNGERAWQI